MSEEAQAPNDAYAGVTGGEVIHLPAPDLPYRPFELKNYHPGIALMGCGDMTAHDLTASRNAGDYVVALCDIDEARAVARRDSFYPKAAVYTDFQEVLQRDDVEVVDIATHPAARVQLMEAALQHQKHVL